MRIGILTFHWGANHGAVLQAYASQKYLSDKYGCQVEIVNYQPETHELSLKNAFKTKRVWLIPKKIKNVLKNRRIEAFRKNLDFTERYFSNKQLINNPPDVDVLITGSDQVWNPYFALLGEGIPTPVYFLNFGKKDCRKVALSVSFGCAEYPQNAQKIVLPYITQFDSISVREKSGIDILKNMGIDAAKLTADPTALLSREHYLKLCADCPENKDDYTALCILRKQNRKTKKTIKKIINNYNNKVTNIERMSVENWLAGIRDAKVVVTNSFHCVMMCLKLHTSFVVVTESGSLAGMNDRLVTLLKHFGLTDCIVSATDEIEDGYEKQFEWTRLDLLMEEYTATLIDYIEEDIVWNS